MEKFNTERKVVLLCVGNIENSEYGKEVEEILNVIDNNWGRDKDYYEINLIGHGCIVMSGNIENLKNLKYYS